MLTNPCLQLFWFFYVPYNSEHCWTWANWPTERKDSCVCFFFLKFDALTQKAWKCVRSCFWWVKSFWHWKHMFCICFIFFLSLLIHHVNPQSGTYFVNEMNGKNPHEMKKRRKKKYVIGSGIFISNFTTRNIMHNGNVFEKTLPTNANCCCSKDFPLLFIFPNSFSNKIRSAMWWLSYKLCADCNVKNLTAKKNQSREVIHWMVIINDHLISLNFPFEIYRSCLFLVFIAVSRATFNQKFIWTRKP